MLDILVNYLVCVGFSAISNLMFVSVTRNLVLLLWALLTHSRLPIFWQKCPLWNNYNYNVTNFAIVED